MGQTAKRDREKITKIKWIWTESHYLETGSQKGPSWLGSGQKGPAKRDQAKRDHAKRASLFIRYPLGKWVTYCMIKPTKKGQKIK